MLCLLAQLDAVPGSEERNAARAVALLHEHPDARLAVFPELYLGGYWPALRDGEGAQARAALAQIADAARETATAVVVGVVGSVPGGHTSSAACIDEHGDVVATCHKTCLFGQERDALAIGPPPAVVELAGERIGVLICFDVEFPELARRQAVAGATLLVTVAANMDPYARNHRLHSRARALENGLPHLYVNRVGREGDTVFAGGTRAIDAHGEVHAEAPGPDERVLLTALPVPELPYPDQLDYVEVAARLQGAGT
jgi:predicted amidohydrolase